MMQYVNNIIVPFVEQTRESLGEDKVAVAIMDNFKGQVTSAMTELLERHCIHTCLIPPNTTDRLQPMDISVNKPAKAFLKEQFQKWYSEQVIEQLNSEDFEIVELEPVELSMAVMKEIRAQWLVDMAEYISNNPDFIVNGFSMQASLKHWVGKPSVICLLLTVMLKVQVKNLMMMMMIIMTMRKTMSLLTT